jgi:hypothetical protein
MMDKINELRKDFGLNNETKMVVMFSISTNDMSNLRFGSLIALQVCCSNVYVKMFIMHICTEMSMTHALTGTNRQK